MPRSSSTASQRERATSASAATTRPARDEAGLVYFTRRLDDLQPRHPRPGHAGARGSGRGHRRRGRLRHVARGEVPVALTQVCAVLRHLAERGPELGVDPSRLAIGGTPPARTSPLPRASSCAAPPARPPRAMVLLYGVFDRHSSPEAAARYGGAGYMLGAGEMEQFWKNYLCDVREADDPLVSRSAPTSGTSHRPSSSSRLRPPRRAEPSHVSRLAEAGVPVRSELYEGDAFLPRGGVRLDPRRPRPRRHGRLAPHDARRAGPLTRLPTRIRSRPPNRARTAAKETHDRTPKLAAIAAFAAALFSTTVLAQAQAAAPPRARWPQARGDLPRRPGPARDVSPRPRALDEANRRAGLPPRQLFVHSDGASWDFLLIQDASTRRGRRSGREGVQGDGLPTGRVSSPSSARSSSSTPTPSRRARRRRAPGSPSSTRRLARRSSAIRRPPCDSEDAR